MFAEISSHWMTCCLSSDTFDVIDVAKQGGDVRFLQVANQIKTEQGQHGENMVLTPHKQGNKIRVHLCMRVQNFIGGRGAVK